MLLDGICVITLTPFDDKGEIDISSLQKLTEFYIDSGVHGMTILGIMGESHKLTESERDLVIKKVVEETKEKVPIIVGCTAQGTNVAQKLAMSAEELGANAVMVASPRNLNDENQLYKHYKEISDSIGIPIVVQDEPVTTGVKMSPDFLARLANEIENVKYVKLEEAPTTVKTTKILERTKNMEIFGGLGGMYFYEELNRGAVGIMTGFAYPEVLVEVYQLFKKGEVEEARKYFYRYLPLIRFEAQLGIGGVTIRKETFKIRNVIANSHVRSPGSPVDQKTLEELKEIIEYLNLNI